MTSTDMEHSGEDDVGPGASVTGGTPVTGSQPPADKLDEHSGDVDLAEGDQATGEDEAEAIAQAEDEGEAGETDGAEEIGEAGDPDEIPEDATGYIASPAHDWGEADQPLLDAFYEKALELELPKGTVQELTGAEARARMLEADATHADAVREVLLEEFGSEAAVEANVKLAKSWLKSQGELGDALRQARLPDGRRLANVPEFVSLLADLGKSAKSGAPALRQSSPQHEDSAIATERAELMALQNRDPTIFMAGDWRESGKSPAARLEELRPKSAREHELLTIQNTDISRLYAEKNSRGETLAQELDRLRGLGRGEKRKSAA